jgi:hypothetical protein
MSYPRGKEMLIFIWTLLLTTEERWYVGGDEKYSPLISPC